MSRLVHQVPNIRQAEMRMMVPETGPRDHTQIPDPDVRHTLWLIRLVRRLVRRLGSLVWGSDVGAKSLDKRDGALPGLRFQRDDGVRREPQGVLRASDGDGDFTAFRIRHGATPA